MKAVQRSGTYLNSASELMKNGDDEAAIGWYEKVLYNLAEWESSDHLDLLREKALTGLGSAWFRLGDGEKAIKSFQEARQNVKKESTDGKYWSVFAHRQNILANIFLLKPSKSLQQIKIV
jgi:tetratricopeptide (TPR) repeat protein